jgi:putative FmdB family regulatory protein
VPTYDFECRKCRRLYDALCPYDEAGRYAGVTCPHCNSGRKRRVYNGRGPHVKFANPQGTSKWDSFTYRAGYNMEKARGERRAAEAASHMGASPYAGVDDLSGGQYFGEVK